MLNTIDKETPRRLSSAGTWALVLVLFVVAVVIHSEIIITRQYAPETLLIRVGTVGEETSCLADITTNDTTYQMPMRQIASIYEYLDSSIYTVTPETGYFVLETGLQNYSKDFMVQMKCNTTENVSILQRTFTKDNNSCLDQEKGRFIVCY